MSEAQKCFTYLKDNSPKWLSDLLGLEEHVEQKQKEMAKEDGCAAEVVFQRVRNGSVASLRDQEVPYGLYSSQSNADGSSHSPEDSAHPSASRRRNVLLKRNKQPASLLSTVTSGAEKFRARSMIIVYYDAEIQKAFEKLVREIGNGRHLIRKAKMAAQAEAFAGGINDDDLYGRADEPIAPNMRVMNFRRTAASASQTKLANGAENTTLAAYEQADKALERAQNLCERAAHQFLRDGDCGTETEHAKEAFQEILGISSEELSRLELKEKASDTRSYDTKRRSGHANNRVQLPVNNPNPSSSSSGFANIEVDDEEEQMPMQLPTLRMTSRMGPRRGAG